MTRKGSLFLIRMNKVDRRNSHLEYLTLIVNFLLFRKLEEGCLPSGVPRRRRSEGLDRREGTSPGNTRQEGRGRRSI